MGSRDSLRARRRDNTSQIPEALYLGGGKTTNGETRGTGRAIGAGTGDRQTAQLALLAGSGLPPIEAGGRNGSVCGLETHC